MKIISWFVVLAMLVTLVISILSQSLPLLLAAIGFLILSIPTVIIAVSNSNQNKEREL